MTLGGVGIKRGLAQVITTLILLVASILISGIAIQYSVNLISTSLQTEDVRLTKEHIWVNSSGAVGALKIRNLGGRDILIDKIEVRGVESNWPSIYYYRVPSDTSITGDLNVTSYDNLSGSNTTIDGRTYNQAPSDIALISGGEFLIYIKGPDNITIEDIGTTVSFLVSTGLSQYITECNVEHATQ